MFNKLSKSLNINKTIKLNKKRMFLNFKKYFRRLPASESRQRLLVVKKFVLFDSHLRKLNPSFRVYFVQQPDWLVEALWVEEGAHQLEFLPVDLKGFDLNFLGWGAAPKSEDLRAPARHFDVLLWVVESGGFLNQNEILLKNFFGLRI